MHTPEYKAMMSKRKRDWWKRAKENPEQYNRTIKKIGESSKGRIMPKGDKAGGWKGGRYSTVRDKYVYIYCPTHPFAKKGGKGGGGYVLEHRLVMEKILGRYLEKKEDVHHINGVKDDNRKENLMLVSHSYHYQEHTCPKCGFKYHTQ